MKNKVMDDVIAAVIGFFLAPLFMTLAWNNIIAWEFNLPTFDYGAFLLIRLAYLFWFRRIKVPQDSNEER